MDNAKKDDNGRDTLIGVSSTDGDTIIPVEANPTNHGLKADDDTTGSDNGNNNDNAMIDENSVSVMTAHSSDGSGNIVEVYIDPITNKVLISST